VYAPPAGHELEEDEYEEVLLTAEDVLHARPAAAYGPRFDATSPSSGAHPSLPPVPGAGAASASSTFFPSLRGLPPDVFQSIAQLLPVAEKLRELQRVHASLRLTLAAFRYDHLRLHDDEMPLSAHLRSLLSSAASLTYCSGDCDTRDNDVSFRPMDCTAFSQLVSLSTSATSASTSSTSASSPSASASATSATWPCTYLISTTGVTISRGTTAI
jgi:hypothetical protein